MTKKIQTPSAKPVAICDRFSMSATEVTNIVVENRIITIRKSPIPWF